MNYFKSKHDIKQNIYHDNGDFSNNGYKDSMIEVLCDIRDVLVKILYKN